MDQSGKRAKCHAGASRLQRRVSEVIGLPAPQIAPKSFEKVHINQSLKMNDLRGVVTPLDPHR